MEFKQHVAIFFQLPCCKILPVELSLKKILSMNILHLFLVKMYTRDGRGLFNCLMT